MNHVEYCTITGILSLIPNSVGEFFNLFCRYGELEGKQLRQQMATVILPDASAEDTEGVVAGLASSVGSAAQHVESAARRCRKLTGAPQICTTIGLCLLQSTDAVN